MLYVFVFFRPLSSTSLPDVGCVGYHSFDRNVVNAIIFSFIFDFWFLLFTFFFVSGFHLHVYLFSAVLFLVYGVLVCFVCIFAFFFLLQLRRLFMTR